MKKKNKKATKEIIHSPFCQCRCEQEYEANVVDDIAQEFLQSLYESLGDAVADAFELEMHWKDKKDKRHKKVQKAKELIFEAQGLLNEFAEDEDIDLV